MHIFIDINGTPHSFDPDQDEQPLREREVVAKAIVSQSDGMTIRYFVLVSQRGVLFNPLEPGTNINRIDRQRTGLSSIYDYNLRKCSKQCHTDYVTFLRSKNKTHLLIAQRRAYDEF